MVLKWTLSAFDSDACAMDLVISILRSGETFVNIFNVIHGLLCTCQLLLMNLPRSVSLSVKVFQHIVVVIIEPWRCVCLSIK